MSDGTEILRETTSVLLVDWPAQAVPEAFARAGIVTHSHEGPDPDEYVVYEPDAAGGVAMRHTGQAPAQVDLVYTYRPVHELLEITDFARELGARAVWFEAGGANAGATEEAREVVEQAGLIYVDQPVLDALAV